MNPQYKSRSVVVAETFPGLAGVIEIGNDEKIIDLMTTNNSSPGDRYIMLPEGLYVGHDIMIRRMVQPGGLAGTGSKLKVGLAKSLRGPQGFMVSGAPRYTYLSFTDPNYTEPTNITPGTALLRWTGNDWLIYAATNGVLYEQQIGV